VQERTNREIKRRARVMQVFPSIASLERLVGAVICDVDDEWHQRRYFSEARMAELYADAPAPEPADEGRATELQEIAERTIEASLGLADEMEAA
jgi:hypothetical protein